MQSFGAVRVTTAIGAQSSDALAFAEAADLSYRLQKRRDRGQGYFLVSYRDASCLSSAADVSRRLALVSPYEYRRYHSERLLARNPPLVATTHRTQAKICCYMSDAPTPSNVRVEITADGEPAFATSGTLNEAAAATNAYLTEVVEREKGERDAKKAKA